MAFAAKLLSIEEAPEPFRSAMVAVLKSRGVVRLLIFGPAENLIRKVLPASLLAILEHEWIVVVGAENAGLEVHRCDFAHTLFVEMVSVLASGRLRLDFVKDGRMASVAVQFNTVMEELYQEAVQILLDGIDGIRQSAHDDCRNIFPSLNALSLKFHNGILRYLPVGQPVLGIVHWPAVEGRRLRIFWQEIAPEGVLVLTSRQLILISEEKARWRSWPKYGYVVTYCPLSRVEGIRLRAHNSFDTIDVDVRVNQIGDELKIGFPCEIKPAMAAFTDLVISSPGFLRSRPEARREGN